MTVSPLCRRLAAGIALVVCALVAVVVVALPQSAQLEKLQVRDVNFRFQKAGVFYGKEQHIFLGNPVLSRLKWFVTYRTRFPGLNRLFPPSTHGVEWLGLNPAITNRPVLYVTWCHKNGKEIIKNNGGPPSGPFGSISHLECYLTAADSSHIPLRRSSGSVSLTGDCGEWWPLPSRLTNINGYTAHFVTVSTVTATTNDDVATLALW